MSSVYGKEFNGRVSKREFSKVFSEPDCRLYRLKVKVPGEESRTYNIRAKSKQAAKMEARGLVVSMIHIFKDERIAWKLTDDKNWNFGTYESDQVSAGANVAKFFNKAKLAFNNYFIVGTELKDVFKQQ